MILDEAINILKSDIDYNKSIGCDTSNAEQLTEWLEELKEYKEIGTVEGYKSAIECYTEEYTRRKSGEQYNKGIDDFVRFANTMPTVEEEDGEIRPMWLEEMAEQLKVGDNVCEYKIKDEVIYASCNNKSIASAFCWFNECGDYKYCPYCGKKITEV